MLSTSFLFSPLSYVRITQNVPRNKLVAVRSTIKPKSHHLHHPYPSTLSTLYINQRTLPFKFNRSYNTHYTKKQNIFISPFQNRTLFTTTARSGIPRFIPIYTSNPKTKKLIKPIGLLTIGQVVATCVMGPLVLLNHAEKAGTDDAPSTTKVYMALGFMVLWSVVAAAAFWWYTKRHVVQISYAPDDKTLRFYMFTLLRRSASREVPLQNLTLHKAQEGKKSMSFLFLSNTDGSHFLVERSGKVLDEVLWKTIFGPDGKL